jgi:ATP-dependent RNA helicase DeaD
LIQRFVSVEFNRFLDYYKDIPDLDQSEQRSSKGDKKSFRFTTFKLNLGSNIGMNKRELMRFVNQLKVTRSIEIGLIEIMKEHSFIALDAEYEEKLLKAFNRSKFKGVRYRQPGRSPGKRPG